MIRTRSEKANDTDTAAIVSKKKITIDDSAKVFKEIDLENNLGRNDERKAKQNKPSPYKSVRYFVMLVALVTPLVSAYSKSMINFTIIRMIDPECIEAKKSLTDHMQNASDPLNSRPYFELDNSCPVDEQTKSRLLLDLGKAKSKSTDGSGELFKWDEQIQGFLKAAFSFGHIPLQVYGSRLAEIYDAHRVLSASILVTAISSFLAPFLAQIHWFWLFVDLFFMGIVGSFITPVLITLFTHWLTPGEKQIMMTCYLITSRLGSALTSFICGELFQAHYSWRYVFFSAAVANFLFVVIFYFLASSRPVEHFLITAQELNYLASKNTLVRESLEETKPQAVEISNMSASHDDTALFSAQGKEKRRTSPPWRAILTSVPVWSFVITKFCVKLAGDVVQIELPTYLDRVMHYDSQTNGYINSNNYIIFCAGCFVAGGLAKVAVKRKPYGLSKTAIRKIFQSFASFGVSLLILGMTFSMCHSVPTIIFLLLWFFTTTFGTGGENQIPMDITERYPGTIHAIASSMAISGVLVPITVGAYLKGHPADRDRWSNVWYLASAISFIGGLVFVFGADASVQPFDTMTGDEEDKDQIEKKGALNRAFEIDTIAKKVADGQAKIEFDDITSKFKESKQI